MPHHHCCILGCRSDSRYSKMDNNNTTGAVSSGPLRFFCIPSLTSKYALHKQWIQMIGRPDLKVSRNTRVCSLHFIDEKPTKENPLPTLKLICPPARRSRTKKNNLLKIAAKTENDDDDEDEIEMGLLRNDNSPNNNNSADKNGALHAKSCNNNIITSGLPFDYGATNYCLLEHHKQSLSVYHRDDDDDDSEMDILPETIIHEYKQTQTEPQLFNNTETQTEISSRLPLILRDIETKPTSSNYCFQCPQLRKKMINLKQQMRRRLVRTEFQFGIEFVKLDDAKLAYYTGLPSYVAFTSFLNDLKPSCLAQKLKPAFLHLNTVELENELFLALATKRLHLLLKDLAYRCGLPLARVENIISRWNPILDSHPSKPWLISQSTDVLKVY